MFYQTKMYYNLQIDLCFKISARSNMYSIDVIFSFVHYSKCQVYFEMSSGRLIIVLKFYSACNLWNFCKIAFFPLTVYLQTFWSPYSKVQKKLETHYAIFNWIANSRKIPKIIISSFENCDEILARAHSPLNSFISKCNPSIFWNRCIKD